MTLPTELLPPSTTFNLKPGGQGRIRTSVAHRERQIYSLLPLTTRPPVPVLNRTRMPLQPHCSKQLHNLPVSMNESKINFGWGSQLVVKESAGSIGKNGLALSAQGSTSSHLDPATKRRSASGCSNRFTTRAHRRHARQRPPHWRPIASKNLELAKGFEPPTL